MRSKISSLFITPHLPAAFLAWLFVVLPCTKDLEDPFAFNLLLEPSEGPFERFVVTH